ncbi:MAG: von Willebrand factor type A [Chloroflexi bacterium OLB15]|nr:MAG: von Willebrand factor type A [Chloroflexi bacterium OLB15]
MKRIDFNPYILLSVAPTASADDIKAAYRRAARRLHPDANRSPGAAVQFQDITTAFDLLSDDAKRAEYDADIKEQPEGMAFNFRVIPSKRTIGLLPEPQVFYLLADIIPDARANEATQKRESRLNLTLILDHSNSMSGNRLDRVKIATHQIIDQLSSEDILSVVAFNDFAEVVIPATTVTDKAAMKARVSMMMAAGSTEIFQGLSLGLQQNRQFLAPRLVNHVILLTDGRTYGDEDRCLDLAREATKDGISISAMGLGQEWNDKFLDELASLTGGSSAYVQSSSAVVAFLNEHVRSLANVFAERMTLSVAPDPDVRVESVFKLAPNPQPLPVDIGSISLGSLQVNRTISVLIQLEVPKLEKEGFRTIGRLAASGDVFANRLQRQQSVTEIALEVMAEPPVEEPPTAILDALGKLTLYRMQERANEALENGDVREATRLFENLATRLFELGESDLAQQARAEAEQVAYTKSLSDKGRKAIKYQTRHLLLASGSGEASA